MKEKLENLNMTSSYGYIVENLWSGEHLGKFQPWDELKFSVRATGVVMLKATVITASTKNPPDQDPFFL